MTINRGQKRKFFSLILIFAVSFLSSACQPFNKNKTKVLLIGLDGASWNIMQPLIEDGKLSNIKQLMDKGCYGMMRTFAPLESEVIWTDIATAKKLSKHGIIHRMMEDPDTGEYIPVSSNLRKAKAIWAILSENKKRVGIVNYMVTWPPEKVNGVLISGRKVFLEDITYSTKNLSYPPFAELCSKEEFEGFKGIKEDLFADMERNRFPDFYWSAQKVDNFMANFSKHLLKNKAFDLFILYMGGIDIVSHYLWEYAFPEGFDASIEEINKYGGLINNYYIWCDKFIGRILKDAAFDLVIIVSDHGFESKTKKDYHISIRLDYLLMLCGLDKINKHGKTIILKNTPPFGTFTKNVMIFGNLSSEEFYAVREWAKETLKKIVVKETGDRPFADLQDTRSGFLVKAPELYRGKNSEYHVIIRGKECKIADLLSKRENPRSGNHSTSAVIIVSGKNICRNKKINSATIYDITPTILYYLGLPVAKDMDGRVLFEAFEECYLRKTPIQYITTYETEDKKGKVEKPIRSPDEEMIKERMRSLGYIN